MFVWEKLRLYAHLIADWPRHNFHEKSKKSAGFFRFFIPDFSIFYLRRNLEPPAAAGTGTWNLAVTQIRGHRRGTGTWNLWNLLGRASRNRNLGTLGGGNVATVVPYLRHSTLKK